MGLIAGVFIAAGVFTAIQIQSPMIAFMGLSLIMLANPVAIFFYTTVLGVRFFGMLNMLSLFLLIGIGCDDIFVLCDTWKQSRMVFQSRKSASSVTPAGLAAELETELRERVYWTLSKASTALAITSSTTAVACFGCMVSSIGPLRFFGLYAGLVVPTSATHESRVQQKAGDQLGAR